MTLIPEEQAALERWNEYRNGKSNPYYDEQCLLQQDQGNLCDLAIGEHLPEAAMASPLEEGWYWYRASDNHRWSIVEVFFSTAGLMVKNFTDDGNFVENYPGQWIRTHEPMRKP